MKFETARDAIEAILEANAAGNFQVITGQTQDLPAETVKGSLRTIQVFYNTGEYSSRTANNKLEHKCTFQLVYYVASPAKGDKATLDDKNASEAAKMTALVNIQNAFGIADKAMDEFRRMVTQIIMDPINEDLGFVAAGGSKYDVGSRWLDNFTKHTPIEKGRIVLLTAEERLTFTVTEELTGATPVAADTPLIDLTATQQSLDEDVPAGSIPKAGVQTIQ